MNKGFVEAKRLARGDLLVDAKGRFHAIVEVTERRGKVTVYNFEVEGTHTYFAGGLWVHNADCGRTLRDLMTPEELAEFEALNKELPDWMPNPNAPATTLTPAELKGVRGQVRGAGHHRHPLSFGGDPNPQEGLVPTGDTRGFKNPDHLRINRFWNAILRRLRGAGG